MPSSEAKNFGSRRAWFESERVGGGGISLSVAQGHFHGARSSLEGGGGVGMILRRARRRVSRSRSGGTPSAQLILNWLWRHELQCRSGLLDLCPYAPSGPWTTHQLRVSEAIALRPDASRAPILRRHGELYESVVARVRERLLSRGAALVRQGRSCLPVRLPSSGASNSVAGYAGDPS